MIFIALFIFHMLNPLTIKKLILPFDLTTYYVKHLLNKHY